MRMDGNGPVIRLVSCKRQEAKRETVSTYLLVEGILCFDCYTILYNIFVIFKSKSVWPYRGLHTLNFYDLIALTFVILIQQNSLRFLENSKSVHLSNFK